MNRNDPCGCGSGKKAKKCCAKPGRRVPGCYADQDGTCEGGLSAEHYISRALLDALGDELVVEGLPWLQPGEQRRVGLKALTARILCQGHNSGLSACDEAAARFLRILRDFDRRFREDDTNQERLHIRGMDLERWLLKLICGLVASGNAVVQGQRIARNLNPLWVDVLFERVPWPPAWELRIGHQLGDLIHSYDAVRTRLLSTPGQDIQGVEVVVAGVTLMLGLGKMEGEWASRPSRLVFRNAAVEKTVELGWLGGPPLTFERRGTYDGEPPWIRRPAQ